MTMDYLHVFFFSSTEGGPPADCTALVHLRYGQAIRVLFFYTFLLLAAGNFVPVSIILLFFFVKIPQVEILHFILNRGNLAGMHLFFFPPPDHHRTTLVFDLVFVFCFFFVKLPPNHSVPYICNSGCAFNTFPPSTLRQASALLWAKTHPKVFDKNMDVFFCFCFFSQKYFGCAHIAVKVPRGLLCSF